MIPGTYLKLQNTYACAKISHDSCDSDSDDFWDDEDARPKIENPDAVYIFALTEFKDDIQLVKREYNRVVIH